MAKVCVLGVDAAKGKSTVCLIDEYGEVLLSPEDVAHTRKDLDDLDEKLKKAGRKEDMKVVMEATGIYHWPVFDYLEKKGYFISVINPPEDEAVFQNLQLQRRQDRQKRFKDHSTIRDHKLRLPQTLQKGNGHQRETEKAFQGLCLLSEKQDRTGAES